MNITWNTDIYCLIGHPISKSLSPIIHNNYNKINKMNSVYLTFDIEKHNLQSIINSFKIMGIKGFNVTLPHKIKIMEYLDDISNEAKIISAVNTVKNVNGSLIGYNTDGIGFLKSLELENISVKDKVILLLGAGGVANAIATSLAIAEAKKLIIINRTVAKAKNLTNKIKNNFSDVLVEYGKLNLNNILKDKIDMVINCTSIGMYPNIEYSPITFDGFSEKLIVFDTIYKPKKTKFLQLAEEKGYKTINGLSMLINQAIFSQKIWHEEENINFIDNFEKIRRIIENYEE